MSRYTRVIPRDLFNEADLLKCMGRLSLLIHDGMAPDGMELEHFYPENGFDIGWDENDGSIWVTNMRLVVAPDRPKVGVWRPLNSRDKWPVYVYDETEDRIFIFDDEGNFRPEFLAWVKGSLGGFSTEGLSEAEVLALFEGTDLDTPLCDLPDSDFNAGGRVTNVYRALGYDESGRVCVNQQAAWGKTIREWAAMVSVREEVEA